MSSLGLPLLAFAAVCHFLLCQDWMLDRLLSLGGADIRCGEPGILVHSWKSLGLPRPWTESLCVHKGGV